MPLSAPDKPDRREKGIPGSLARYGARARAARGRWALKPPLGAGQARRLGRDGPLAVFPFCGCTNFPVSRSLCADWWRSRCPPGGIVIPTGWQAPTGSPEIVRINKMGNRKLWCELVRVPDAWSPLWSGNRLANCESRATRCAAMSTCRCRSKASSRAARSASMSVG
jgi:hypothetical protein